MKHNEAFFARLAEPIGQTERSMIDAFLAIKREPMSSEEKSARKQIMLLNDRLHMRSFIGYDKFETLLDKEFSFLKIAYHGMHLPIIIKYRILPRKNNYWSDYADLVITYHIEPVSLPEIS